ncbi:MAG: LpqN/LpqT family lipoprotein [Mycobacterium sp.]|nr:LpqN/LpqT family lipoprotein [Mycobacterium sp.]
MRYRSLAVLVAAGLTVAACGSETPDYQSIWTTSSTPVSTSAAASTEPPVPFPEYLEGIGVTGEPVAATGLPDLTVTLPLPKGWAPYRNPNLSPQTEMIARNGTYPTAMVLVFRLHGNFDVDEAIKHANADALRSKDFTKLNESFDKFDGFPSAMIEGSYAGPDGTRLHTYNRVVIPVTKAPAFVRYLVQFTVTSRADQAVADSDDIQAIIDGFAVSAK